MWSGFMPPPSGSSSRGGRSSRRVREGYPDHPILLTFFSPSGYEVRKDFDRVDSVHYLPLDTPGNARKFLDVVQPKIAVFIRYEYWYNFLRRHVSSRHPAGHGFFDLPEGPDLLQTLRRVVSGRPSGGSPTFSSRTRRASSSWSPSGSATRA